VRQRAPSDPLSRLAEGVRAQRTPGAGRFFAASPVFAQQAAAAQAMAGMTSSSSGAVQFWNDDIYDITADGPQDLTLTYLPIEQSLHVELRGVKTRKGEDWTLSGNVLSLLGPLDVRIDDVVTTEYAFLSGLPVPPAEPEPDLGPYVSKAWIQYDQPSPIQHVWNVWICMERWFDRDASDVPGLHVTGRYHHDGGYHDTTFPGGFTDAVGAGAKAMYASQGSPAYYLNTPEGLKVTRPSGYSGDIEDLWPGYLTSGYFYDDLWTVDSTPLTLATTPPPSNWAD
jgi:hypothetical protein